MSYWEDLGEVTAYAQAKEQGYLGTKEEFETMLKKTADWLPRFENAISQSESETKKAKAAAESAQTQAAAARQATEELKNQVHHLTFQVNETDGGLDIIYTE